MSKRNLVGSTHRLRRALPGFQVIFNYEGILCYFRPCGESGYKCPTKRMIQNFLSGRLFTSPSRIFLRQHDAQGKEKQQEAIVTAETRKDYGVGERKPQKPTPPSPSYNLHSPVLLPVIIYISPHSLSFCGVHHVQGCQQ